MTYFSTIFRQFDFTDEIFQHAPESWHKIVTHLSQYEQPWVDGLSLVHVIPGVTFHSSFWAACSLRILHSFPGGEQWHFILTGYVGCRETGQTRCRSIRSVPASSNVPSFLFVFAWISWPRFSSLVEILRSLLLFLSARQRWNEKENISRISSVFMIFLA